jgi:CheY-like chemotaxis protein
MAHLEALPRVPERRHGRLRASHSEGSGEPAHTGARQESVFPRRLVLPRNLVDVDVVVVDDDADTLEYFAAALRACGAAVRTAGTAEAGLGLVRERAPRVVLSDIAMRGHDGYWLVQELQRLAAGGASPIAVVAITAYGREHSRERALAAGFVDQLRKPIEPEVLCAAVAAAAGR